MAALLTRPWALASLFVAGLLLILVSQQSLTGRTHLPPAATAPSAVSPPPPLPALPAAAVLRKGASAVLQALPQVCRINPPLAQYIAQYVVLPKEGLLVWSCPPERRCGGYGDRMKGIASAFLLALLTRRQFGIFHTDPVELREVLRPTAHVAWDVYPKARAYPVQIKDRPPRAGKDVVSKMPPTVWLETNQDLVEYLQSLPAYAAALTRMGLAEGCVDLSCVYGCLFNTLFDVGEGLQSTVASMLEEHPQFVSVQIRTGGGEVSGWSDPMRTSHYVVNRMWDAVDDWTKHHCLQCDIFLTTDSATHQKLALQRYGKRLFFVKGDITHSDRSSQQKAALGFPKVVLDNLMIGFAVHGVISNSGFSYTAVWRTRLNSTVVRMNRERTGYFIEPHLFTSAAKSWTIVTFPLLPLA
eukprot:EG_transcript_12942